MAFQAQFWQGSPLMVDHTPSGAVAAGDVVVIASVPHIAHRDIPANRKGALAQRGGVYKVAKATGGGTAIAAGKPVWFKDSDNTLTETATSNTHFGETVAAAADGDAYVYATHEPQGLVGAIV